MGDSSDLPALLVGPTCWMTGWLADWLCQAGLPADAEDEGNPGKKLKKAVVDALVKAEVAKLKDEEVALKTSWESKIHDFTEDILAEPAEAAVAQRWGYVSACVLCRTPHVLSHALVAAGL